MRLEALDAATIDWQAVDRVAAVTPEIDAFCSSSLWSWPAAIALQNPGRPLFFQQDEGYALFVERVGPGSSAVIEPLEASWLLGSPVLGRDLTTMTRSTLALLARRVTQANISAVVWSGVPPGGMIDQAQQRARDWATVATVGTHRHVASLAGGFDGYVSRRSRNWREQSKRAARKLPTSIRFETWSPALIAPEGPTSESPEAMGHRLWDRIARIEARSWKGLSGAGVDLPPMSDFYRLMIVLLLARGCLRLAFLQRDGEDIGYILGAVFGDRYRGLQFSFDERFRAFALGNLLQEHVIAALCAEGVAWYDLGTENPYKARWAERIESTLTKVLVLRQKRLA